MSKDLFSKQSDIYARYRPGYPAGFIDYILQFVPERDAAWDCATGNGQAALLLASHFKSVEATDISAKQISNAIQHPRIHYSVAPAEKTAFTDHSFDLVTVAQAYHWLNFAEFKNESTRVLKPNGVIAVWGYSQTNAEDEGLNSLVEEFYENTVGPYWNPERKFVEEHYRTTPFPYEELPTKEFFIEKQWSVEDLSGYLRSWSSVQHFINAKGFDPVEKLQPALKKAWPSKKMISFRFPLFLRLGRPIK
jgi:ubiquinone/menaquinone biosynthesis C-methylase UbiE